MKKKKLVLITQLLLLNFMITSLNGEEAQAVIPVLVDIAPDSSINTVGYPGETLMTISIPGSAETDVGAVDAASIRLTGPGLYDVKPVRYAYEDGSSGFPNLILQFDLKEIAAQLILAGIAPSNLILTVKGHLAANQQQIITGSDFINIMSGYLESLKSEMPEMEEDSNGGINEIN